MSTSLTPLEQGATLYIARKNRTAKPLGHYDNAMRWQPADSELQECCYYIRSPSCAYPWSMLKHCSTAEHVAHMFKVDEKELRKLAKAIEKEALNKTQSAK
jgi:hypothetical protein